MFSRIDFLAASVLAMTLSAQERPTLPDWAVKRAVSLGRATDCGNASAVRTYSVAGAELRVQPGGEMIFRGSDHRGSRWKVSIGKPGDGGCRLFVTDLDGDGNRDLILLNANGGSGPNGVTMTIVAFDSVGRPVPWQATGPFELEDDRLTSLVDLDGDKRAELLFQYVEGTSQEMSIHTALYKIVSGHFKRVDGMFAGRSFPLEQVGGEPAIDIPDLSNSLEAPAISGSLARLTPGEDEPCSFRGISLVGDGIVIQKLSELPQKCHGYITRKQGRVEFPLMTVLDLPGGERFVEVNHSAELIERAVRLDLFVSFVGRTCETGCRPFIMWARSIAP